MPRTSLLLQLPPAAVSKALVDVGAALRLARVRRNWTQAQLAERIGAGVRAVAAAERGAPGTALAVTVAMLWALGLLQHYAALADSTLDIEGERRARLSGRGARRGGRLVPPMPDSVRLRRAVRATVTSEADDRDF